MTNVIALHAGHLWSNWSVMACMIGVPLALLALVIVLDRRSP